jgi:hypothetical protein
MAEFDLPLLIATIDSNSQISIPHQAQAFFGAHAVKQSSPATVVACFNFASNLFPNLFPSSSCSTSLPNAAGIWLRHLHQQDDQPAAAAVQRASSLKKAAAASPLRDEHSEQVLLILDLVVKGLSQVCGRSLFDSIYPCGRIIS